MGLLMPHNPGPGEKVSGQVDEKPLLAPVESAKHHTLERPDTHNTLDRLDTARKRDLIKAQDGYCC